MAGGYAKRTRRWWLSGSWPRGPQGSTGKSAIGCRLPWPPGGSLREMGDCPGTGPAISPQCDCPQGPRLARSPRRGRAREPASRSHCLFSRCDEGVHRPCNRHVLNHHVDILCHPRFTVGDARDATCQVEPHAMALQDAHEPRHCVPKDVRRIHGRAFAESACGMQRRSRTVALRFPT
jgi:hypothetical protein